MMNGLFTRGVVLCFSQEEGVGERIKVVTLMTYIAIYCDP